VTTSQLFLHHYFPALYFAILGLCQIFDFATARVAVGSFTLKNKPYIGRVGAVVFLALSIVVFYMYTPLIYGNTWTKGECNKVKLFETWDWDCNTFYDTYADYSLVVPSAPGPAPTGQAAHAGPAAPVAEDPRAEVMNTPGGGQPVVRDGGVTEEKIEFRDENGNLLDEEQVKQLEGKVSFSTRYETRTRLVDQAGNEVSNEVVQDDGAAEPQPAPVYGGEEEPFAGTKAEGVDPETVPQEAAEANTAPPKVSVGEDLAKERSVEQSVDAAEPESRRDEL